MVTNQEAATSRLSLQTSPWRTDIRTLLISAMIVFLITVAIGLLNGQRVVQLSSDVLLTHVHAGTIGWITLSVLQLASGSSAQVLPTDHISISAGQALSQLFQFLSTCLLS